MNVEKVLKELDNCLHLMRANFEVLNPPEADELDETCDPENPGFLIGFIRYLDVLSNTLIAVDEISGEISVSVGDETDAILKTDLQIENFLTIQKYKSNMIENHKEVKGLKIKL
jgi:hypothetical protein